MVKGLGTPSSSHFLTDIRCVYIHVVVTKKTLKYFEFIKMIMLLHSLQSLGGSVVQQEFCMSTIFPCKGPSFSTDPDIPL